MSLVAIQIEDNQILVASARASSKRLQVSHLFSIELSGNDEVAAEALKSKLAQHGLTRSDAIVVISRADAEMRELVIPPAPDNEVPEMVRFVARNEFASLNDQWALDYLPISGDSTRQRTVLAVGISVELQDQVRKITSKAGLKVKHIVLRPLATLDLIHAKLTDGACRLIVDPNGDQTDMTVVVGDALIATRTVLIPESYDANRRSDSMLSEVRRTLASSRNLLGDRKVSQVMLFGDADRNKSLEGNLRNQLELEIEYVQPDTLVPFSSGCDKPDHAERYAAVLGALVQHTANRPYAIDFTNPRRPVVVKKDFSNWYLYGGLASAATLMAVLAGWYVLHGQANEIELYTAKLASARRLNAGDENTPGVDQILAEVGKIDQWRSADVNWLQELGNYSQRSLTPDDSIVDSLETVAPLREGSDPRMVVNLRITEVVKESQLIDELGTGPYQVTPTRGTVDASDKDYPLSSSLNITLERDQAALITEFDERANEFLQGPNEPTGDDSESAGGPGSDTSDASVEDKTS